MSNVLSFPVHQIIDFVTERQKTVQSVVLSNSEGFWGDDGDYLSLQGKHNFQTSHLGFLMGQLRNQLQVINGYLPLPDWQDRGFTPINVLYCRRFGCSIAMIFSHQITVSGVWLPSAPIFANYMWKASTAV